MRTALADDFTDWVDAIIDAPTENDVHREVGGAVAALTRMEDGAYYSEVVWRITSAARARHIEFFDQWHARQRNILAEMNR